MNFTRMTIFLNEADQLGEVPLYEEVMRRLQRFDIAGATLIRGLMGYGRHGRMHRKSLFGVSDDCPILIFVVDERKAIESILPELKAIVTEGLITLEPVEVP